MAVDLALHVDPPILQGSEKVEMAFQGHRDLSIFTTKRLITIDKKGLFGKRIEYFSVPWEKVRLSFVCVSFFLYFVNLLFIWYLVVHVRSNELILPFFPCFWSPILLY